MKWKQKFIVINNKEYEYRGRAAIISGPEIESLVGVDFKDLLYLTIFQNRIHSLVGVNFGKLIHICIYGDNTINGIEYVNPRKLKELIINNVNALSEDEE